MRQEVVDLDRPQLEGEDVLIGGLREGKAEAGDGGIEKLLRGGVEWNVLVVGTAHVNRLVRSTYVLQSKRRREKD